MSAKILKLNPTALRPDQEEDMILLKGEIDRVNGRLLVTDKEQLISIIHGMAITIIGRDKPNDDVPTLQSNVIYFIESFLEKEA